MKIVFASSNPHLPQIFGGVEFNTHQLALQLKKRGHDVAVLTMLSRVDLFGIRREAQLLATRRSVWLDNDLGYPVYRARNPWAVVPELPQYDFAILTNGKMLDFARSFAKVGTQNVAYLHGVTEFKTWSRDLLHGPDSVFNGLWSLSEFTAEQFRQVHGLDSTVIRPIFRSEEYKTEVRGRHVTFINPVAEKGVDLALQIAALCPDIPFVFVVGWPLGLKGSRQLRSQLRKTPNVRLQKSTYDIRTVHQKTRILLVPTSLLWEETWGRVASEAQINGIPVVASNHGALPESVGTGGILLDYKRPAEEWASVIRRLWSDDNYHSEISRGALAYSKRPELNPEAQVDLLVSSLEQLR